jgi:DNA topoisomerase-1
MVKKYELRKHLVIVESPAKCKKIEGFLGSSYKCMASFGHLRELSSLQNVSEKWESTYTIPDNPLKQKQIDKLREEIKNVDEVILATDDDREGEAIAWHLCQLFRLDVTTTKRIVFHEITETALQSAVLHPRRIDMNKVFAQQGRQILDLLVGFKVSPSLWQVFSKKKEAGLSAGRCQTPALRLIYDNDRDIQAHPGITEYQITALFTKQNIPFEWRPTLSEADQVIDLLTDCEKGVFVYDCSKPEASVRKAPEPFITSTLQQSASNEFHFSPKDTMRMCQSLYEAGYITYMRTDSKKYSREFMETAKQYILQKYDAKYLSPDWESLVLKERKDEDLGEKEREEEKERKEEKTTKTKPKKQPKEDKKSKEKARTQDAHEAIRPTDISLQEVPMDPKEQRLYKLIWERTVESCMSPSLFYKIKASMTFDKQSKREKPGAFFYDAETLDFPGWLIVKKTKSVSKEYPFLLQLQLYKTSTYKTTKVQAKQSLKEIKSHYSEAKLVQLLEDKGIGRPSTYSSLVDKIQERGYVKKMDVPGKEIVCKDYELNDGEIVEIETLRTFGKEKGKLVIQSLGVMVIEFLLQHFETLFAYDYTKNMENALDDIAEGNKMYQALCEECNKTLEASLLTLKETKKREIVIDEQHSYLIGKYGPVIKCTNEDQTVTFQPAKADLDVRTLKDMVFEDMVETKKTKTETIVLGIYEDKDLVLKKGKFGAYVEWGTQKKSIKGNRPLENIRYEEVVALLSEGGGQGVVRSISDAISIRSGKYGDYVYYKTTKMKKPSFYKLTGVEDYKTCDVQVLKQWLHETYHI